MRWWEVMPATTILTETVRWVRWSERCVSDDISNAAFLRLVDLSGRCHPRAYCSAVGSCSSRWFVSYYWSWRARSQSFEITGRGASYVIVMLSLLSSFLVLLNVFVTAVLADFHFEVADGQGSVDSTVFNAAALPYLCRCGSFDDIFYLVLCISIHATRLFSIATSPVVWLLTSICCMSIRVVYVWLFRSRFQV